MDMENYLKEQNKEHAKAVKRWGDYIKIEEENGRLLLKFTTNAGIFTFLNWADALGRREIFESARVTFCVALEEIFTEQLNSAGTNVAALLALSPKFHKPGDLLTIKEHWPFP